jgi:antitoxin VapB
VSLNLKKRGNTPSRQATGFVHDETMTEAVTRAVAERLDRVRRAEKDRLSDRLLELGKDCAAHLRQPFRSIDQGDLLYGEDGLPR